MGRPIVLEEGWDEWVSMRTEQEMGVWERVLGEVKSRGEGEDQEVTIGGVNEDGSRPSERRESGGDQVRWPNVFLHLDLNQSPRTTHLTSEAHFSSVLALFHAHTANPRAPDAALSLLAHFSRSRSRPCRFLPHIAPASSLSIVPAVRYPRRRVRHARLLARDPGVLEDTPGGRWGPRRF